jgi:hypothetical protein
MSKHMDHYTNRTLGPEHSGVIIMRTGLPKDIQIAMLLDIFTGKFIP